VQNITGQTHEHPNETFHYIGVVIALDRQEITGKSDGININERVSAIQSVEKEFGVPVASVADLTLLLKFLESNAIRQP